MMFNKNFLEITLKIYKFVCIHIALKTLFYKKEKSGRQVLKNM